MSEPSITYEDLGLNPPSDTNNKESKETEQTPQTGGVSITPEDFTSLTQAQAQQSVGQDISYEDLGLDDQKKKLDVDDTLTTFVNSLPLSHKEKQVTFISAKYGMSPQFSELVVNNYYAMRQPSPDVPSLEAHGITEDTSTPLDIIKSLSRDEVNELKSRAATSMWQAHIERTKDMPLAIQFYDAVKEAAEKAPAVADAVKTLLGVSAAGLGYMVGAVELVKEVPDRLYYAGVDIIRMFAGDDSELGKKMQSILKQAPTYQPVSSMLFQAAEEYYPKYEKNDSYLRQFWKTALNVLAFGAEMAMALGTTKNVAVGALSATGKGKAAVSLAEYPIMSATSLPTGFAMTEVVRGVYSKTPAYQIGINAGVGYFTGMFLNGVMKIRSLPLKVAAMGAFGTGVELAQGTAPDNALARGAALGALLMFEPAFYRMEMRSKTKLKEALDAYQKEMERAEKLANEEKGYTVIDGLKMGMSETDYFIGQLRLNVQRNLTEIGRSIQSLERLKESIEKGKALERDPSKISAIEKGREYDLDTASFLKYLGRDDSIKFIDNAITVLEQARVEAENAMKATYNLDVMKWLEANKQEAYKFGQNEFSQEQARFFEGFVDTALQGESTATLSATKYMNEATLMPAEFPKAYSIGLSKVEIDSLGPVTQEPKIVYKKLFSNIDDATSVNKLKPTQKDLKKSALNLVRPGSHVGDTNLVTQFAVDMKRQSDQWVQQILESVLGNVRYLNTRKIGKPDYSDTSVLVQFQRLKRKELVRIQKFMKEMDSFGTDGVIFVNGKEKSPLQLTVDDMVWLARNRGLSKKEVAFLESFYDAHQTIVRLSNAIIGYYAPELGGIPMRLNMVGHRFKGAWRVDIKFKGSRKADIIVGADTKIGAILKAKKYKKKYGNDIFISKPRRATFTNPDNQAVGDVVVAAQRLGLDLNNPILAELVTRMRRDPNIYGAMARFKRHRRKTPVKGYVGEEISAFNAKMLIKSEFDMMATMLRVADNLRVQYKMKELHSLPGVAKHYPNSIEWSLNYWRNANGMPYLTREASGEMSKNALKQELLDKFLTTVGVSNVWLMRLGGIINTATLKLKLYTGAFFYTQFMQPTYVAPYLHYLKLRYGLKGSVAKAMVKGTSDFFVLATKLKYAEKLTKREQQFMDFVQRSGAIEPRILLEALNEAGKATIKGKIGEAVDFVTLSDFAMRLEELTRFQTLMMIYRFMLESGKEPLEALTIAGKRGLQIAVDYSLPDRPPLFTQTGGIGTAFGLYKTWNLSYLSMTARYAKFAVTNIKTKKDLMRAVPLVSQLGLILVHAGLKNAMLIAEYELIAELMNKAFASFGMEIRMPSLVGYLIKSGVPDWMLFGIASDATGTDLATTNAAPTVTGLLSAPGWSYATEVVTSTANFLTNRKSLAAEMRFVQSIVPKYLLPEVEAYYTKKVHGKIANVPVPNPKKNMEGMMRRTIIDWWKRMASGSYSTRERRMQQLYYMRLKNIRNDRTMKDVIVDSIVQSLMTTGDVPEYLINKAMRVGIDPDRIINLLNRRADGMNKSMLDRLKEEYIRKGYATDEDNAYMKAAEDIQRME